MSLRADPRLSGRGGAVPHGHRPGAGATDPAAAWDEVKAAASEAILAAGGTITHHHAVGRDHAPWYRQQVPGPFLAATDAARRAVDPAGICNPGVLGTTPRG